MAKKSAIDFDQFESSSDREVIKKLQPRKPFFVKLIQYGTFHNGSGVEIDEDDIKSTKICSLSRGQIQTINAYSVDAEINASGQVAEYILDQANLKEVLYGIKDEQVEAAKEPAKKPAAKKPAAKK